MPTDTELKKEILDRAERRKQDLMRVLGDNILVKNNLSNDNNVNPWCSTNKTVTCTDIKRNSRGGKENHSPEQRIAQLMYPARPARSVYNSPLIKTNRPPLWKSPPPYAVSPSIRNSVQNEDSSNCKDKDFAENPFKNNLLSPSKISLFGKSVPIEALSESNCNSPYTSLKHHRLYPSLPRSDVNDKDQPSVVEKDLKEYSNRSTAEAERKVSQQPQQDFRSSVVISPEVDNLTESSVYIKDFQKNDLHSTAQRVKHFVPSDSAEDLLTSRSNSENDIEDTYDMDKFLEEALGSALHLNSTMNDCLPSDLAHSPFPSQSLGDIHSTSTLRSPMCLLNLDCQNDKPTDRISHLLREAEKQQQVMAQASKALSLCKSSKVFSHSLSLVDAERLLLLATLRHKAALDEVRGQLSPPSAAKHECHGQLRILEVSAPLKEGYLTLSKPNQLNDLWFLCILSFGQQILASDAVALEASAKNITFSCSLELVDLPSSFVATLQIFTLRMRRPQDCVHKSKMSKAYKLLRRQSKSYSKSCLGAAAGSEQLLHVRTPAFSLSGTMHIDVSDAGKSQPLTLYLDKVPIMCPLEGCAWIRMETSLVSRSQFSGFLTILEKSGESYAWQRRWCHLNGMHMLFWNYPSDEGEKEPVEMIDLRYSCSDQIEAAPRHLCARPRTFMLEISRAASPNDLNSTIMECNSDSTILRFFLSCDSAQDMKDWMSVLNTLISSIKKWNVQKK